MRRALEQLPTADVRLLVRRPPDAAASGVEVQVGDLLDPPSLSGVTEGVDVVIHCASYIGSSADLAARTNVLGTSAILGEAGRTGVRRVVYVSTAAVYGRGPFRDRGHRSLVVAPSSPRSETRARAERLVLDAGGVVLRPNLVYGTGDRCVGAGALRLGALLGGRVAGLDALVSMIDVRRLADAAVGVALLPPERGVQQLYDCNHPAPVVAADCLRSFLELAGVPSSSSALSVSEAQEALRELGEPTHDLEMLGVDHWFDSAQIWADLQLDPGPPFPIAVADHREWYRRTG